MKFHPSEEQVAIQDTLRGMVGDVWPMARVHAFAEGTDDFDAQSWDALMALGLGGLLVPEAAGGTGLGLLDAAMVCEVLGEAVAPGPVAAQMLTAWALHASANPVAKAHLPAIIAGEKVATLAWGSEPDGTAWLPDRWSATATSGHIAFVESARRADLFLLGTAGGGLALVEAGTGVEITAISAADRTRPLGTITLSDARSETLFEPGDPFVARLFDAALVLNAAEALGGAQRCLDLSVGYAGQREQFGVAIGRFQALKHQLAQMALEIEPARALVWYAGYAIDSERDDAPRAAAIAKAHLADRFVSVARAAVAAHGGIGYTWEFGLHYWLRRSLALNAWLGSPTLHRARAAALAGW